MQTSTSANLANFTSQSPEKVLWELYRIRKRILLGEKIEMPAISLLLFPEGNFITGYFVDMKSEGLEHHIAMELADYNGPTGKIFFAYLAAVRGITIENIAWLEHILNEVTASTTMVVPPQTTRMQLKRKIGEEASAISAYLEKPIAYEIKGDLPDDAQHLFVISNLLTDITVCLKNIAQTDIGKAAVKEINSILFDYSSLEKDYTFLFNDKVLTIKGNFWHSFTTSIRRSELRDKIESVL